MAVTNLTDFGESKFPDADLLGGSAGRGWTSLAAELRTHPACEVPAICPDQMEITLAVQSDAAALVERRGDGSLQRTAARPGTLWFCPIGVQEDSIRISGDLAEVLHLYIPNAQFALIEERSSRAVSPQDVPYLAGVEDELVRQIAYRILREVRRESAGGRLLVEQLSLGLVAHLVSTYAADAFRPQPDHRVRHSLDERRLRRVLDYMEDHLESDLPLAKLAEIACLSRSYFARAFRDATGLPPHRYISARRLELARRLLANRQTSLADIAHTCQFSSQASFTRAFHRQMNMSPGQYRRHTQNRRLLSLND